MFELVLGIMVVIWGIKLIIGGAKKVFNKD